jgi:hypothetical protein
LLDDSACALRLEAHQKRQRQGSLSAESSSRNEGNAFADVIDGRRDPYLFFPFDVFQQLVDLAYSDDSRMRVVYRDSKEKERRDFGLPETMWDRLEGIVAAYRAAQSENHAYSLSQKRDGDSVDLVTVRLCRERYAVLIEAQRTFARSSCSFSIRPSRRTCVGVTWRDLMRGS